MSKVLEVSKHIRQNRNYGFRKSALEDASEATHLKPFRLRELLGRVAQDEAAHGALWPTTVEHYPGAPDLRLERGTRAEIVLMVFGISKVT